jgi:hypothetical protein
MRSDRQLKSWFNRLNQMWFGGALPSNTKVFYAEELTAQDGARHMTFAETEYRDTHTPPIIRIHPMLRERMLKTVVLETLIHEMAHVEEFISGVGGDHGPGWESIMLRLAQAGAFSKHNGIVKNSLW